MAIGEAQILGQVRSALKLAQDTGSAGRVIGQLMQQALRVGKRARAETGLDRAGASLVEAGLEQAAERIGPLSAAGALVLGAGAMAGLVAASLQRVGMGKITVVSRTADRAERLALSAGGRALPMTMLPLALAGADLVVSSAGAGGYLVDAETAASAQGARDGRRQLYLDLAMPRDVDPAVAGLPGIELVDLEVLGRLLASTAVQADLADRSVEDIGPATLAAELYAVLHGADIIRTHDPRQLRDALRIWAHIASGPS
jgi:glutamyl-tRNA reductase